MSLPRRQRRPWVRRLRRVVLVGGAAVAITTYRNRKLAENEARYQPPGSTRE